MHVFAGVWGWKVWRHYSCRVRQQVSWYSDCVGQTEGALVRTGRHSQGSAHPWRQSVTTQSWSQQPRASINTLLGFITRTEIYHTIIKWVGLTGTATHSNGEGIWMDPCVNGTTTVQGWTQPILKSFLDYAGKQGAQTVTIWSGLTATPQWVTANVTNNVTHKTTKDWPHGWLKVYNHNSAAAARP